MLLHMNWELHPQINASPGRYRPTLVVGKEPSRSSNAAELVVYYVWMFFFSFLFFSKVTDRGMLPDSFLLPRSLSPR